jgi:hypothetical protein
LEQVDDPRAALFVAERDMMQVLLGGNRQIESQQGAAAGDALLDQLQEAGIAVLVANPLAART